MCMFMSVCVCVWSFIYFMAKPPPTKRLVIFPESLWSDDKKLFPFFILLPSLLSVTECSLGYSSVPGMFCNRRKWKKGRWVKEMKVWGAWEETEWKGRKTRTENVRDKIIKKIYFASISSTKNSFFSTSIFFSCSFSTELNSRWHLLFTFFSCVHMTFCQSVWPVWISSSSSSSESSLLRNW